MSSDLRVFIQITELRFTSSIVQHHLYFQSRNPAAVQPHLKKCFDNIVQLQMEKVSFFC
jgi:hypothetical protein